MFQNDGGYTMFSFRDLIIFLAGAEFFHTITHIMLAFWLKLPMDFKFMVLTEKMNLFAIILNALITILLLWWGYKMK